LLVGVAGHAEGQVFRDEDRVVADGIARVLPAVQVSTVRMPFVNGHSFFPIDGLEFSPLVATQIFPTVAR
jgi:hypothetical protein